MDILFKISIVLAVGILGGKIVRRFKLPDVTGYLVAGLFLGPSFFKLITEQEMQSLGAINELALAVIAFTIGSEFVLKDMMKVGKTILVITIAEVVATLFVVFGVMYYIFAQPFAFSIVIASMSAATAPAATIMVINQFRADGPLTRTILPVVALDDVGGIIAFGIALSVAKLTTGVSEGSFLMMISQPFIEIIGSIILGLVIGTVLTFLAKKASNKEELLAVTLAIIGASIGLANVLGLSSLLVCIMVGATLVNLFHNSNRVFSTVTEFISPIYILFFTLAGASLDLAVLSTVGLLGLGYILARSTGKILGAYLGAKVMKADPAVVKYLGLSLLPQGGISIGLSIIVRQELPEYSLAITTIIMFSVLVYEVSGPILAKIAIQKAGEIDGKDRARKNKKSNKEDGVIN